jgi:hypothetical protein
VEGTPEYSDVDCDRQYVLTIVTPDTSLCTKANQEGGCGGTAPFKESPGVEVDAEWRNCGFDICYFARKKVASGVCFPAGTIEICSAYDPDVNEANACTLVSGFSKGPCFEVAEWDEFYGCASMAQAHEDVHVAVYREYVEDELGDMLDENPDLFRREVNCEDPQDCLSAAGEVRAQVEDAVRDAFGDADQRYNEGDGGEARAEAVGDALSVALANEICERISAEGWASCPLCPVATPTPIPTPTPID